jgi:MFS family permease
MSAKMPPIVSAPEEFWLGLTANPADHKQAALRLDHCRRHLHRGGRDRRCACHAPRADRAFEKEFHWSRATISFALGINLLLYGAIGPFAAAVMDRFGARRTMTLALAATTAGVALTPAMSEPWQLVLLWGIVIGLSTGFIGAYLAAYIAARWFRAREGLVVGVLTAANAAGQLIFLPTMAALATQSGWRIMSLVLAGTVIA